MRQPTRNRLVSVRVTVEQPESPHLRRSNRILSTIILVPPGVFVGTTASAHPQHPEGMASTLPRAAGRILSAWPRVLHRTVPVQTWGFVAQMYLVETAHAAHGR